MKKTQSLEHISDVINMLMGEILKNLPSATIEDFVIKENIIVGFRIKAKSLGTPIVWRPETLVTASMNIGRGFSNKTLNLLVQNKARIDVREETTAIHDEYPEFFLDGNSQRINELLEVLLLCIYTGKTIKEIKDSNSLMRENSWMKKPEILEKILEGINNIRLN